MFSLQLTYLKSVYELWINIDNGERGYTAIIYFTSMVGQESTFDISEGVIIFFFVTVWDYNQSRID